MRMKLALAKAHVLVRGWAPIKMYILKMENAFFLFHVFMMIEIRVEKQMLILIHIMRMGLIIDMLFHVPAGNPIVRVPTGDMTSFGTRPTNGCLTIPVRPIVPLIRRCKNGTTITEHKPVRVPKLTEKLAKRGAIGNN